MKKIIIVSFIALCGFLFIPQTYAAENKIGITCDKIEVYQEETVKCAVTLTADKKVYSIEGIIEPPEELEIVYPLDFFGGFTDNSEENNNQHYILVNDNGFEASNAKFMEITLKNISSEEKTVTLQLKNNKLSVEKGESRNTLIDSVATMIELKSGTDPISDDGKDNIIEEDTGITILDATEEEDKNNPKTGAALSIGTIVLLIGIGSYVLITTRKNKRMSI